MSISTQAVPALRRTQRRNSLSSASRASLTAGVSRIVTILVVVFILGIMPLLSGRDIAMSVYRSRYAEGEVSPGALEAIRKELGLEGGPLGVFFNWLGGAVRGDFGVSWATRKPVLPDLMSALGVSLTIMLAALLVGVVLGALLTIPTFRRGLAGRSDRTGGGLAAAFTALPEFLMASVLLVVFAVWLGWLPPFGWRGPEYAILPALAMGLPTGGFLGRLLSDGLATTFSERWVATWQVAGFSKPRIIGAVIRRTLPGVTAPMSLILVGITAGAVVIEQVYAIPGIGRATLNAAQSQDLPVLQTGVILLMVLRHPGHRIGFRATHPARPRPAVPLPARGRSQDTELEVGAAPSRGDAPDPPRHHPRRPAPGSLRPRLRAAAAAELGSPAGSRRQRS